MKFCFYYFFMPLDTVVENLGKNDKSLQENLILTKKIFGDKWQLSSKKLTLP